MHPDPILEFTLFNHTFSITLYGICISVGLIACLIVLKLYTDHRRMKTAVQDYIFFIAILAIALGFVGAMLFQSVYNYIETEFGNSGRSPQWAVSSPVRPCLSARTSA